MKKLVVITGASSGFGASMAKAFNEAGYPLLLIARRIDKLLELNLDNTICKKVDVTDYEALEQAVLEAEKVYGSTDLLINNAGAMLLGNLENQDRKEWQQMLDVNVMGIMNGMQIVTNAMKDANHGTIVNFSSIAGVKPFVNHTAYCASKYAVTGLSEVSRQELSSYNVRVMRICPGAVNTELLSHTTNKDIVDGYHEWVASTGANSITAEDIAKTVLFAYEMPQSVNLREIQIADTKQDN